MQNKERFDQIDFRLDRLVSAVLTLTDSMNLIRDDLAKLKDIVQRQVLAAQEHHAWIEQFKLICQQQADTARQQSNTIEYLITYLITGTTGLPNFSPSPLQESGHNTKGMSE
ncbi:MAG: hypothetical protein Q6J46_03785 [Thermostichus sp. DG02_2_bins_29]